MTSSANRLLRDAAAAIDAGRLDDAEALLRRALARRPDDAEALNRLGLLRVRRGDPEEAAALLSRAVEADPPNARLWNNLGNVRMAARRLAEARAAFDEATRLAPALPSGWSNRGVCLRRSGDAEGALASYRRALEADPRFAPAHENLCLLLDELGRGDEARDAYARWLAIDPGNAIARHRAAARADAAAPPRAADGYVAALFDRHSTDFDDRLAGLGYQAPRLLAELAAERLGAGAARRDVLDAGCGTGLCGPLLRPLARRLVGVDLSPRMVERARARGLYDELHVAELCAFMEARPGAFDLVVSADTLVYFGELEGALRAARACLRPGGLLAFSLEALAAGGEGHRLAPNGRYAHAAEYVLGALAAAGFAEPVLRAATLRREGDRDVPGHLASARA